MSYFTRTMKMNPNHDPATGEFTSAGGGGADLSSTTTDTLNSHAAGETVSVSEAKDVALELKDHQSARVSQESEDFLAELKSGGLSSDDKKELVDDYLKTVQGYLKGK